MITNFLDTQRLGLQGQIVITDQADPTTQYIGTYNYGQGVVDVTKPGWFIKRVINVGTQQIIDLPLNATGTTYINTYSNVWDDRATLNRPTR